MSNSKIQEFYNNQTIFVTGGTGLLGKLLVQKLLHSCYGLKKIYLLIREKKGRSPADRLDEFLESYCFQHLKAEKPDFKEKICLIEGDCALPDLGISKEDRITLINEVSCIIHSSATVRFDEQLRVAGYSNVRAVLDLVELAKQIKNLKSIVYVSTAFSNSNQKDVTKETFYEPTIKATEFLTLLEETNDETLDANTSQIIGEWPNTYTFTKAIAENIIKEKGIGLPIAVVRPSVVMGAVNEPEPGFTDTIQGLLGICLGVYLGIIHCSVLKSKAVAAIVPSDYVVNNILSVGWHLTHQHNTIPIYNFTGSDKNQLTWEMYLKCGERSTALCPSVFCVWWPFLIITENLKFCKFCEFWFHTAPAHITDCILKILRKKPQFVRLYQRVNKSNELVSYFSLHYWKFETTNTEHLWKIMNEKDKEIFPFNMDELQWENYINDMTLSARVHIVKDPLDTLPQAKRRLVLLRLIHYIVVALLFYFCFILLRFLFNVVFHRT